MAQICAYLRLLLFCLMLYETSTERSFDMNQTARNYIDLFRSVKIASAATVDEQGRPQSRINNEMIALDEGLVIVTSRGKPFWKQLVETERIALSAMCPDCQSLKFTGKVRRMEDQKKWVDAVFEHNPGMNEVYPGQSRYALDTFLIYEGTGEWFDLLHYPISREAFAFGGAELGPVGFRISERCTGCGCCAAVCLQQSIRAGSPYAITPEHCLQCGLCAASCPAQAIDRLHP